MKNKKTWMDITYSQYEKIKNEKDVIKQLSILSGVDVEKLKMNEIKELIEEYSFISTTPPILEHKIFYLDGIYYGLANVEELTYEEWMLLNKYIKNSDLKGVVSVLYRPIISIPFKERIKLKIATSKKDYNGIAKIKYKVVDYSTELENDTYKRIDKLPFPYFTTAGFFFQLILIEYLTRTQPSFKNQNLTEELIETMILTQQLQTNGQTIQF